MNLNFELIKKMITAIEGRKYRIDMGGILRLPRFSGNPGTFGEALKRPGATVNPVGLALAVNNGHMHTKVIRSREPMLYWIPSPDMVFDEISAFHIAQELIGLTSTEAHMIDWLEVWPIKYQIIADQNGEDVALVRILQRILDDKSAEFLANEN